jgi:ligand-binding SRPBCC domain-containing protein
LRGAKNGKDVGMRYCIVAKNVNEIKNKHKNNMVYEIKYEQDIPTTKEKIWEFISSPLNLKDITPPYMGFEVTSAEMSEKMYPGMMITYKVRPLLNIPINWCTEITHVDELNFFVDEQREGPYTIWHHQHHIKEITGGVKMIDIIHYKVPFGFLGKIANMLFVKKQLQDIFDYRFERIDSLFGKMK